MFPQQKDFNYEHLAPTTAEAEATLCHLQVIVETDDHYIT